MKAAYLKEKLASIDGVRVGFTAPTFNEFTIKLESGPEDALKRLLKKKIIGGLPLGRFYPGLSKYLLITATEMNTRADIDRFVLELERVLS